MDQFFKISDFAKKVGKHANTVDNWFKLLEEKKLHYVNRIDNEKVYDELDLQIAQYINARRNDKWALEAICNELPERFGLRPFPPERETTSAVQPFEMESIRKRLSDEIREAAAEIAAAQIAEIKQQHKELLGMLPKPRDPLAERQERVTELLGRRRVERALEKEALHLWATKLDSERMKRVGLFRKEEDRDRRDQFVKDYIDEHFESRLRDAFGEA